MSKEGIAKLGKPAPADASLDAAGLDAAGAEAAGPAGDAAVVGSPAPAVAAADAAPVALLAPHAARTSAIGIRNAPARPAVWIVVMGGGLPPMARLSRRPDR